MSLAGCSLGKFKAEKLCQSSSISGPSDIEYPIRENISIISFFTIDNGCLDPKLSSEIGKDKSKKLSPSSSF